MAIDTNRAARIASLCTPSYTFRTSIGNVTIVTKLFGMTPASAGRIEKEQQIAKHRCEQLQPTPVRTADDDYRQYKAERRQMRDTSNFDRDDM